MVKDPGHSEFLGAQIMLPGNGKSDLQNSFVVLYVSSFIVMERIDGHCVNFKCDYWNFINVGAGCGLKR